MIRIFDFVSLASDSRYLQSWALKNFVPELAPIIRDIYKQSLREGYIPFLLKSSIVSPLPKVIPPRAIESDLRPISLTCTFVKVMEGFTCMQKTYTPTG